MPEPTTDTTAPTDFWAATATVSQALALIDDNPDFGHARDVDPDWPVDAERDAILALRTFRDRLTANANGPFKELSMSTAGANHSTTSKEHERFHMRIANGGTPERVESGKALREINNAMMGEGRKPVREMSAAGGWASIVYNDLRGRIELRPATVDEAASPWKPEAERYTSGDRVVVRPVIYIPETRTHKVLPEYEGVVSNWASTGHYMVRDADGGVRPCRVHELRPVPPTVDDVVDAPHALFVSGELKHEGLPADRIRRCVSNLRFQRKAFTQDTNGAICVDNRRYVPQPPPSDTETTRVPDASRASSQD